MSEINEANPAIPEMSTSEPVTGGESPSLSPGEPETEPEFHLDAVGKVRYIWMRLGTAVFRERVPLHVFKMNESNKKFHLEQIADRLKKQLTRDMRRSTLNWTTSLRI